MQFYKISYEVIGYCNLFLNWEKPVSKKKKAKPNYKLNIKMKVVQPHPIYFISHPMHHLVPWRNKTKHSTKYVLSYWRKPRLSTHWNWNPPSRPFPQSNVHDVLEHYHRAICHRCNITWPGTIRSTFATAMNLAAVGGSWVCFL